MKIQVLGTGCPRCKKVAENALDAVKQAGIEVEIEKVESLDEIMKFGVMMTPALVIDGEVKCSGRVPDVEEIATWLTNASE
jgi:small redox-active disulfide protein 2